MPIFRSLLIASAFFVIGLLTGIFLSSVNPDSALISPLTSLPTPTPIPRPLLKYTFNTLSQYQPQVSALTIETTLDENPDYTANQFSYTTEGKRMTGQINLPTGNAPSGGFPAILMIRGFAESYGYQTGNGTRNAAAFFAQNGFVTVAPDFLGYGGSDDPPNDAIAARLQKPLHLLDLLASMKQYSAINPERIGIWAHSNGGQITLSLLEITGEPYPATLWAPVSKPFPYSILYFTDTFDDGGKALRQSVAGFESLYDAHDYSIDRYWDRITAPIQLHQGTADPDVPLSWSNQLAATLEDLEVDISYFTYPGADHNLRPDWNTVVARDLTFFNQHLR